MKTPAIISIAVASMSSTLATAGTIGPLLSAPVPALGPPSIALGVDVPALGEAAATLGTGLTLPTMAAIGAISLIAGIRYIRSKRS